MAVGAMDSWHDTREWKLSLRTFPLRGRFLFRRRRLSLQLPMASHQFSPSLRSRAETCLELGRLPRLRSGLTGLICLLALLGLGQLLLDLAQVLGVERRAHLAECSLSLTQIQGASVEVDADQAHIRSLTPPPRRGPSAFEIHDAALDAQRANQLFYGLVRGVLLVLGERLPAIV